MRASGLEVLAIVAFFGSYVIDFTISETTVETLIKNTTKSLEEEESIAETLKTGVPAANNVSNNVRVDNWMARMGPMQEDLINIQAIIVKDADAKNACDQADRKSNKRYMMCAGSILNRNHILSSASCIHEATHIRHNIRSPLAVVIAPMKLSIQVIRVVEYKIHPAHNTNPYSRHHLTHNVAILKLACRIDMENYFKVDLPIEPFVQTCSEDNCIAAVFRKTGPSSNVMFQIMAPHIPFPNRRRKQTMVKDVELRRSVDSKQKSEFIENISDRLREKRKLAEPPIFISRYEPRKKSNDVSSNSTTGSPIVDSTTNETSTVASIGSKNNTDAAPRSLNDDEYKTWLSRTVGNDTIKSIVRRSSNGYRSCPQTGAAVMSNRTQAAIVAVPCDDRQPSTKWLYTDIWDNLDWIHDMLQDWSNTSAARPSGVGSDSKPGGGPGSSGNYSGCSTCIFNFFIEIGCKDKKSCGNKSNAALDATSGMGGSMNQNQGCGNSIGIEVGIGGGQGCDKKEQKGGIRPEFRSMPGKPIDLQIGASGKPKNLPSSQIDSIAKLQQPTVTGDPAKNSLKDPRSEKEKYGRKDDPQRAIDRSLLMAQKFKNRMGKNLQRGHVTNEIGLQSIDGDSTDWLTEVVKGLEMSAQKKRELVESRRVS